MLVWISAWTQSSQCPWALRKIIVTKKVGNLFEADIRGYFDHIQHDWLQKMVAYRIADPLIRLIGKWLNAGSMVEEL